mmetsp:Transcript_5621/g.13889  ORF Transcript_5621/g.13889 Transcript_5621/m.13889 type:complete len:114 (+) Transcript_5621:164-505(+)
MAMGERGLPPTWPPPATRRSGDAMQSRDLAAGLPLGGVQAPPLATTGTTRALARRAESSEVLGFCGTTTNEGRRGEVRVSATADADAMVAVAAAAALASALGRHSAGALTRAS